MSTERSYTGCKDAVGMWQNACKGMTGDERAVCMIALGAGLNVSEDQRRVACGHSVTTCNRDGYTQPLSACIVAGAGNASTEPQTVHGQPLRAASMRSARARN
mgnify:FL=1